VKNINRAFAVLILFAGINVLAACTKAIIEDQPGPDYPEVERIEHATLRIVTLNVAHGRKDSINQFLVSNSSIVDNLDTIATLLRTVDADVVALQEADGPSMWSGYFNHVSYVANAAGYPASIYSAHVNGKRINYGTALLSKTPFQASISHDFPESPPTMRKGFTLGQVEWQALDDAPAVAIDIISVHLDFSRKSVRQQQIGEMRALIKNRLNPLVILGDFNSDWLVDESAVRTLAKCTNMKAFEPDSTGNGTYKNGKKRLDWILLSNDLEFKTYRVLPEVVSDHSAVMAEIILNPVGAKSSVDVPVAEQCKVLLGS